MAKHGITPHDSPGLWFLDAKGLQKIRTSPPTAALNAGEVVQIGDLTNNSKTIQHRHIVSIKVE